MGGKPSALLTLACAALAGGLLLAGEMEPGPEPKDQWPWSEAKGGLQSRICFEKRVCKQGEPIVCWIEVRNASDQPVRYDGRAGAPLEILGPDGSPPADITHYYQVALASKIVDLGTPEAPKLYQYPVLKPGQTLRFGRSRLDTRFYLRRPGAYRFAWPGAQPQPPVEDSGEADLAVFFGDEEAKPRPKALKPPPEIRALPPAPAVSIEVLPAPGGGPDGDIVGRLLEVLPPNWRINGAWLLEDDVGPPGYRHGRGSKAYLNHHPLPGLLMNNWGMCIWIMAERAERDPKAPDKPAAFLGSGTLGHVYLWAGREPGSRWDHRARDIALALGVENPPAKPHGPDWGRTVSRILAACQKHAHGHNAYYTLCAYADLRPREGEGARLDFESNLAQAIKGKPARRDPKQPYYEVYVRVVPAIRPGQPSPWDKIVEWESGPGRKGRVWYRVVSDDAAFRKAVARILDAEVARALGRNPPPVPREPPGGR